MNATLLTKFMAKILLKMCIVFLFCFASAAWSINYNLSNGTYPPCSSNSWSVFGTTYTCDFGRVVLSAGDRVTANTDSVLSADNGFTIDDATIGTNGNNISLQADYGTVTITGDGLVNGNVTASSSNINVSDTDITGSLTTGGTINLTNGSVGALVESFNSTVTTNGTDLAGGVSADAAISITGGTLSGNVTVPNGGAILSGVTMTDGSINAGGEVIITNGSLLGSASSSITINTQWAPITVDGSTVYGDLTAPNWSTIHVINAGVIHGTCIPGSTPASACGAAGVGSANLVAHWQLEADTWAGLNNEVIDISGEDLHGRAMLISNFPSTQTANAALPGVSGTCGSGDFSASNGYVLINDDSRLDLAEFTVTAWVNARSFPSGSGLATVVSKDENFEFHVRSTGQINWWWETTGRGGRAESITTGTRLSLNTWHHVAISYQRGSQVIYIDGASAGTLNSRRRVRQNNDGVIIGTDHNALINSRRFDGLIDEVRIYDGALTEAEIDFIRAERHACSASALDHYGISHGGTGVTCEAEAIVITAYDSLNNPIAPPANTTVTLTTSTNTGVWLSGNSYTFTGAETNFTTFLQHITPVTLNINVTDGSIVEDPSLDSSLVFNDTGIKFYDALGGLLPNQVAAITYNNAVLKVIKTDDETGACVARVQGITSVGLAYECRNPGACINTENFSINGADISQNDSGASIVYTSVPLSFNNSGEAFIDLAYSDVGQVRLHGSLAMPASANDPAITLTTASNEFVVKPYALIVEQVVDASNNANPGATSIADCSNVGGAQAGNFVKAGDIFAARVESQNANGQVTPNFGNEDTPESVEVLLNSLVYPSGGSIGVLSNPAGFTKTAPGVFTNAGLRWSEVGSITLAAQIATDNNYLAAGAADTSVVSSTIGRFYPHDFLLTTSAVIPACGAFSYMGQPEMTVNYVLTAHKLNGGLVTNYDANLGFSCPARINYVAENNDDGVNRGGRVLAEPVASGLTAWVGGLWNVSDNTAAFLRAADGSVDGTFSDLYLGISVSDPIFNSNLQIVDMNAATTGDCVTGANCNARQIGAAQDLRFGRLVLGDSYGPESLDLPVEFITQYHNGTRWQKSTVDSCSKLLRNTITYPAGTIDVDTNRDVGIGLARGEYGSIDAVYVNMVNGEANHFFSASGASTGSFPVTIDLTGMAWLQFDWNADATLDPTITGTYQFGSYRGHDRILYWLEEFQ